MQSEYLQKLKTSGERALKREIFLFASRFPDLTARHVAVFAANKRIHRSIICRFLKDLGFEPSGAIWEYADWRYVG